MPGVGLQFPVKSVDGLLVLIQADVGESFVKVDLRELRGLTQHFLKSVERLLEVQFSLVHDAQSLENLRLIRKIPGGLLLDSRRARIVLSFFQFSGVAEIIVKAWRLRLT